MFNVVVRFTLILLFVVADACNKGLIISGMLVQVRAVPKYRSTHISNYQSTERESFERDEN